MGVIMKKFLTAIFLFSFVLFLPIESNAQNNSRIHPYLQMVLLDASNNEMIDVYATLSEQYSLDDLREQTSFLPKKERQKEVARILKEFANQKQQAVRTYLENEKQQNLVSKIDILWAANTIVFSAVPGVIYYMAENFNEISEIRYNPTFDRDLLKDPTEESQEVLPGDVLTPQPGLLLINAPAVWAEGDSGQGIIVANIDTGCDWDHPDLIHNIWNNLGEDADNDGHTIEFNGSFWIFDPGDLNGVDDDGNGYYDDLIGWNFSTYNNNINDQDGHGTHTSGIVCGDGTNGIQTGVAPRAKLMNFVPGNEADYWLAQQYAVDKGADITTSSYSYKWYFSPQPNYPMFRQMTDIELAAGVVHTNSTSNDGNNLGNAPIPYNISAPGNCPPSWLHPDQTLIGGLSSVLGVGNVDASTDVIVSSSPYGPSAWEDIQSIHPSYPYPMPPEYQDYPYETSPGSMGLLKPDVSAPGNGTVSTNIGGGYSSFGGTSGATPHVGGTSALLLSLNPALTPADVSMIIQTTAVEKGAPGKDPRYGAGRIDAYEAYLLALSMIPVELTSFTAAADENSVILNWSTASETNNSGFAIERKTSLDERWKEIGFVPGFGTTTQRKSCSFTDENLTMGSYSYRIKQIDLDGTFEYSNAIVVEVYAPEKYTLAQNFPNPFNPSTTIEFSIPQISNVTIEIYNIVGELVASLVNKTLDAGYHRINFNANNLPSGTYVYQLKASGQNGIFTETKKMLLMK
jgi:subtilisin family serine protease